MKALDIGEALIGLAVGFVYVAALYSGFLRVFEAL